MAPGVSVPVPVALPGALLLGLLSCATRSAEVETPAASSSASASASSALHRGAPSDLPPDLRLELAEHMGEHLAQAQIARDAIIQGSLERARPSLTWLANHSEPEFLPAEWTPYIEAMRKAATRAEAATDIETAAFDITRLAATCGSCHEAQGRAPRSFSAPQPGSATDVAQHMASHQQAVELLWLAVVDNSDDAWNVGIQALSGTEPLDDSLLGVQGERTRELSARVHAIDELAGDTTDRTVRAQVLGQLLSVCVDCHTHYRGAR